MNFSKYNNITAQWFRAAEEIGEDIGVRYGRVSRDSGEVEWVFVCHCDCDGIGGFVRLLRDGGEVIEALPQAADKGPGVVSALWKLWQASREEANMTMAERSDWMNLASAQEGKSNAVAYHLFTEDETLGIIEQSKKREVTVNSLLLGCLDRSARLCLKSESLTNLWTVPVNMRGEVKDGEETQNHVSCVDVKIAVDDSLEEVHQQISRRLQRGEHRANYLLLNLGKLLSHRAKVRYFKKNRLKQKGSVGAFSNLGNWDPKKEMSSEVDWLFCPPVMSGQLLGAGCVTFQGRLGLTLQVHGSIENSKEKAKLMMECWAERALGGSRFKMEVVATSPHAWFLFKEREAYFLDVNCNHRAFGYSWMIELNDHEFEAYSAQGDDFLNQLAKGVQFSAPGVKGSTSPYKERKVSKQHKNTATEAVQRWKFQKG